MKIRAYMTAFTGRDGAPTDIRVIDIPDDAIGADASTQDILNLAFYWGQNDFQSRQTPSLSVGDIVEVPHPVASDHDRSYWKVKSFGFEEIGWDAPATPNGTRVVDADPEPEEPETIAECEAHAECEDEPEDDCCPSCGAENPFEPNLVGCQDCRDVASDLIAREELRAGWDPTP